MNYIHEKQTIFISSVDKLYHTDTHTDFSVKMNINPDHKFDRIALLDFVCPKSFYTVNNNNNSMVITENGNNRNLVMDIGNYSRKSFRSELISKLNDNVENYIYSVTYDTGSNSKDTGKYTITVNTNSGPQPIFIFTNGLTDVMGFEKNSTYTFSNNVLVSQNVVNFRSLNRLILVTNAVQNFNNNILSQVVNVSGDYDYISYINDDPYSTYKDFVQKRSNVFSFRLLDRERNTINTNGLSLSFTVLLFRENRITDMIKLYMKYRIGKFISLENNNEINEDDENNEK